MKKRITSAAALLICFSLLTVFPVAHAEEINPSVPPEETIQQETIPPEDGLIPAVLNPQQEEVSN